MLAAEIRKWMPRVSISKYDLIVSGCDVMGKGLKLAMKEVCQLEDE